MFLLAPKLCGKQWASYDEVWDTGKEYQRRRYAEVETSVNNSISEALLNKYGHLEIKAAQPEVKKLGDGGVLRITVEGWWNRASSWRSAGFGLSLSSFLNSLQSDGHFEVSQSCLNPAWKDAEKREAQKRDRNIQRKRDCRSRTKGRIDDWWNMEEGSESNQKWGEACFMRMTGDKWRKALSAPTQYESYGFFFSLLLFLDVWVICFQQF